MLYVFLDSLRVVYDLQYIHLVYNIACIRIIYLSICQYGMAYVIVIIYCRCST